jgi:hypothetical protein
VELNRYREGGSIAPLILVLLFGHIDASILRGAEHFSANKTVNAVSLPAKQKLTFLGLRQMVEGEAIVLYDNATTKRPIDYVEIYNHTGDLLAVLWFDKFGILRAAVDRGIYLKKNALDGVMVLVLYGDLV